MAIQSAIREIRQKNSGVFTPPIKIGAEQRFVSALLNSHNNNLEEQNILGNDCLTVIWEDSDNIKYTTKKFFDGDLTTVSSNGYYILFTTDYTNSEITAEYLFDGDKIKLPEYSVGGFSFDSAGTYDILTGNNSNIAVFDSTSKILRINPSYRIIKKDVLCLRTDLSDLSDTRNMTTDLLISEKVTSTRMDDSSGKIYNIEKITNYL